jgi:hypothetical protein
MVGAISGGNPSSNPGGSGTLPICNRPICGGGRFGSVSSGGPYIGFPAARIFTALLPRALCLLAFLQFRTLFGPLFFRCF